MWWKFQPLEAEYFLSKGPLENSWEQWGDGEWWISAVHWSLTVEHRWTSDLDVLKIKWKALEDTCHWPLVSMCMNKDKHVNTYVLYTHNTEAKNLTMSINQTWIWNVLKKLIDCTLNFSIAYFNAYLIFSKYISMFPFKTIIFNMSIATYDFRYSLKLLMFYININFKINGKLVQLAHAFLF